MPQDEQVGGGGSGMIDQEKADHADRVASTLALELSFQEQPLPVFINHPGADLVAATFAAVLFDKLYDKYQIKSFLDKKTINGGDNWRSKIALNVKGCAVFVAIVSKEYFKSLWCLRELDLAVRHKRAIITVLIGGGMEIIKNGQKKAVARNLKKLLKRKEKKGKLQERSSVVLESWLKNIAYLDDIHTIQNEKPKDKFWIPSLGDEVAEQIKNSLSKVEEWSRSFPNEEVVPNEIVGQSTREPVLGDDDNHGDEERGMVSSHGNAAKRQTRVRNNRLRVYLVIAVACFAVGFGSGIPVGVFFMGSSEGNNDATKEIVVHRDTPTPTPYPSSPPTKQPFQNETLRASQTTSAPSTSPSMFPSAKQPFPSRKPSLRPSNNPTLLSAFTPAEEYKNSLPGDLCMHLAGGETHNGTHVELYPCNDSWEQQWIFDEGHIRSRIDPNMCIEATNGTLYEKLFISPCRDGADGLHQKWTRYSNGWIQNQASGLYIGVAWCGDKENERLLLELRNEEGGTCGTAMRWAVS